MGYNRQNHSALTSISNLAMQNHQNKQATCNKGEKVTIINPLKKYT